LKKTCEKHDEGLINNSLIYGDHSLIRSNHIKQALLNATSITKSSSSYQTSMNSNPNKNQNDH